MSLGVGGKTGNVPVMRPAWSDLATGRRWRGVVSFIRDWVGPFDSACGMAAEELDEILLRESLTLPAAVREWYQLAARWRQGGLDVRISTRELARWRQGGLNVWISPRELAAQDGTVCILTDTQGINRWGVQAADYDIEDPPVYDLEANPTEIDFPSFTSCVAAMVVNDVIFGSATEEPVELNAGVARARLTCFASTRLGDYYADAILDAAAVVMFAYPGNGPAFGKARTPAGHALLQRLQSISRS